MAQLTRRSAARIEEEERRRLAAGGGVLRADIECYERSSGVQIERREGMAEEAG